MADVTGILLDGWFLQRPNLLGALPLNVLNIINIYREAELARDAWNSRESLPDDLQEVYKELCVNSTIRQWCWTESSLGQSLKKHSLKNLHIFPTGSLDSRLAAIVLAERVREEKKDAWVDAPIVPNKIAEIPDALIPPCARRTWEWVELQVKLQTETVAFNLTSCRPEIRRAYRWIIALAKNFLTKNLPREITLFAWLEGDIYPISPIDQINIYSPTEFLKYYFHGIPPDDKHMERVYPNFKRKLDDDLRNEENDKLILVLDAWLKRSEDAEGNVYGEIPPEPPEPMIGIGPAEV